jgi:transposase
MEADMGHLLMSDEDRQFKAYFEMVKRKQLTLKDVSNQVDLGYRQIKRKYTRWKKEGDAGLVHRSRGRTSNRKHPHRDIIIKRYSERYEDFGPTLAAEKLVEEGYSVNHETLRRWLLKEGLWSRQRKRKPYRRKRERKAQFGEMLQIDGSFHDWFEEGCDKSKYKCLFNIVDDATGICLAHMEEGETTAGLFRALWKWIEKYGIPLSVYVDLKTVYVSPKKENWNYFQIACKKLGIRIIRAYSAQAKGRVERKHGVFQDRFVKELRLKDIRTIQKANILLDEEYLEQLNKKFGKEPRNPISAHRELGDIDLHQIFCWEFTRNVSNDWCILFNNKHYQIERKHGDQIRPNSKICVRKYLNRTLSFWFEDKSLVVKELLMKPEKPK